MGGSWDGDVNDCWEYCYGKEAKVVSRLVQIVNNMGLDGVDIDFEYRLQKLEILWANLVVRNVKFQ